MPDLKRLSKRNQEDDFQYGNYYGIRPLHDYEQADFQTKARIHDLNDQMDIKIEKLR